MDDARDRWVEAIHLEFVDGWARWLSFAAVWLWCDISSKTSVFSTILLSKNVYLAPDLFALVGSVIMLLIIVSISGRLATVLGRIPWIILGTLAFTIGSFLIVVGGGEEILLLEIAGLIMGGIAIGILKIAWGEMFSLMTLQRGLVCMGIALSASSFTFMICEWMPPEVLEVLLVLSGLSCGPLLYSGSRSLQGNRTASISDPSIESKTATGDAQGEHSRIKPSWKFLVLPVLVAFTFGLVRIEYLPAVQMGSSAPALALAMSEAMAGAVLLLFARHLTKDFGATQIYGFGLLFVVFGYLMLSFGAGPEWLGLAVHNFGFAMFYFFMVVFWGNLASRMDYPVVTVYAVGYCVFQFSNLLGSTYGLRLLGSSQSTPDYLTPVLLILGFFVAVLFLFGDSRSPVHLWLTGEEHYEIDDRISDICAAIAHEYKLTAREHEVLMILARGRNASYTARSLGIAYDTAKVHIKNIYAKLDIHNQQDLLDLIDERMSRFQTS